MGARKQPRDARLEQGSGVYVIRCNENNKVYVGSSIKLSNRLGAHWTRLRSGYHEIPALQEDFTKLGEESFCFEIYPCEPSQLISTEQTVIKVLNASDPASGYNTVGDDRRSFQKCHISFPPDVWRYLDTCENRSATVASAVKSSEGFMSWKSTQQ